MPGYTHLQRAQPITLAHHLAAYVEMLTRDRERFAQALERTAVMPLGAGALAGTTLPIDRQAVARELGFRRISENSLDAVSDRDFVVDFLAAAALAAVHLSRMAEEIILWSSAEFGFVDAARRIFHRQLDDAAQEKSRPARTDSRQKRPHDRRPGGDADGAQGTAARV